MFFKAVFYVEPWEAAVVIDVGAGFEVFGFGEGCSVKVDFAFVVIG